MNTSLEEQNTPMISGNKEQIISYQKLRTFIGLIGIFLPIVLVVGSYVLGAEEYSWQHSISHYYYSRLHIVFVCTLCVLGGFLITYKGKPTDVWESRVSNLAGYFALGVAAFPTCFNGFRPAVNGTNQYLQLINPVSPVWGAIHFIFAGLLFVCFILFCLVFFQKADELYAGDAAIKFKRRKVFYKVCGWGIAVSVLALFGFFIVRQYLNSAIWSYSTFWFETTSLLFFGTAWLVKGSKVWKQNPILSTIIKPLR